MYVLKYNLESQVIMKRNNVVDSFKGIGILSIVIFHFFIDSQLLSSIVVYG